MQYSISSILRAVLGFLLYIQLMYIQCFEILLVFPILICVLEMEKWKKLVYKCLELLHGLFQSVSMKLSLSFTCVAGTCSYQNNGQYTLHLIDMEELCLTDNAEMIVITSVAPIISMQYQYLLSIFANLCCIVHSYAIATHVVFITEAPKIFHTVFIYKRHKVHRTTNCI